VKIAIDGSSISFESEGTGPAVLLLHAFPLSSAMWAAQVPALSARHQVVRVDARGFGGSDTGAGPLSMDRIASDAKAALDHLRIPEAVICGCSMGGYAAFAFARLFPRTLRGLVLVDTRAVADNDEAKAGREALAEKVLAQGSKAVAEAMLPKLLGETTRRDRPQLAHQVESWMLAAPPEAVAHALLGLALRPDSTPTLATIKVPTLIVRGEEDPISTAADLEQMRAGIAGSQAVVIPRAGHLVNVEAPEAFGQALSAFLGGLKL
jgi:pimeloyl-ACP methyl ester carboxylesterase